MSHISAERPESEGVPALVADSLVASGLAPADIRRRLHTLFPDRAPSSWAAWLRRDVLGEPVARDRAHYDDRQLRLGVEVVAAVAEGLEPDPQATALLSPEDVDILEDLTGGYDPSGAILANSLMLVGALRQQVHSGQRPVLRQSRYQELLMETRLVADVPQSHQLRWPPAASVVARRLGGGDWARALDGMGLDGGQPGEPRQRDMPVAREILELDDPGIGLIAAPASTGEWPHEVWDELRDRLLDELEELAWKDILVLRYSAPPEEDAPPSPSAWARTGPDGTVISLSGVNSPSALWPRAEDYFVEPRWRQPAHGGVAWSCGPMPAEQAAELMVEGMRIGRLCGNPYRFCWGVGDAQTGSAEEDPQASGPVAPVVSFHRPTS